MKRVNLSDPPTREETLDVRIVPLNRGQIAMLRMAVSALTIEFMEMERGTPFGERLRSLIRFLDAYLPDEDLPRLGIRSGYTASTSK
jgi:hypothetical protein